MSVTTVTTSSDREGCTIDWIDRDRVNPAMISAAREKAQDGLPFFDGNQSENKLNRELNDTRIERAGDRAEVRRAEDGGRRAELWRIEQIEDLGAHFDRVAADWHAAHQRKVDVAIRRPAD